MVIINKTQLSKMLKAHEKWLDDGREASRKAQCLDLKACLIRNVDLKYKSLDYAVIVSSDLSKLDLTSSRLLYADLHDSILRRAILYAADLEFAYLEGVDLRQADLRYADLRHANLKNANLAGADLTGANLDDANLAGAYLTNAILLNSHLAGANLLGANIEDAYYNGAYLCGATNVPFIPLMCPEEGAFIGWKRANSSIIKLQIPADALRSSATTRKCRCNKAKVLAIYDVDRQSHTRKTAASMFDPDFKYTVGKTVKVDDFCTDRWLECAPGIHFFMNKQDAVDYMS